MLEQLAEGVAEARAQSSGDLTGERPRPQQLGAAKSAAAIRRFEAHVRQLLVGEELDVGLRVREVSTRPREIVALVERRCEGALDVGRGAAARLIDRIDARAPERRVAGIHDETPETILGVLRDGLGANQVLATLRHLRLGLHEIQRRHLPDGHARTILADEILGQLERPLLHADIGDRGLERPVRELDRRDRLHDRFAESQLGALLATPGDDVLMPRHVDRAVLEERL